jgi:hypothetical protein
MKVSNYSVRVLNSKNNPANESSEGYVKLSHGENYTLLLRNSSQDDCVASVKIDGQEVAHVKVPANDKVKLDTSVSSDKKFTFYKLNSEEGDDLELDKVDKKNLGLIEVQFVKVDKEFQWKPLNFGTQIIYVPCTPHWHGPYWYYTPTYTVTTTPFINVTGGGTTTSTISAATYNMSTSTTSAAQNFTYTSSVNLCSAGGTGMSGIAEHEPVNAEESRKEFNKHFDEDSLTTIYLRLVEGSELKEKPVKLRGYSNPIPDPI